MEIYNIDPFFSGLFHSVKLFRASCPVIFVAEECCVVTHYLFILAHVCSHCSREKDPFRHGSHEGIDEGC